MQAPGASWTRWMCWEGKSLRVCPQPGTSPTWRTRPMLKRPTRLYDRWDYEVFILFLNSLLEVLLTKPWLFVAWFETSETHDWVKLLSQLGHQNVVWDIRDCELFVTHLSDPFSWLTVNDKLVLWNSHHWKPLAPMPVIWDYVQQVSPVSRFWNCWEWYWESCHTPWFPVLCRL